MPVIWWRVPTSSSAVRSVDVGLLHRDRRVEAAGRHLGVAALDEHTLLARVEQRLHGVGADETQPSGDQDHRIASFRRS